jgi:hypothetical protein
MGSWFGAWDGGACCIRTWHRRPPGSRSKGAVNMKQRAKASHGSSHLLKRADSRVVASRRSRSDSSSSSGQLMTDEASSKGQGDQGTSPSTCSTSTMRLAMAIMATSSGSV